MSISALVWGTTQYSAQNGGSVAPSYPSGITAGQKLLLVIGMKPSTANSGSVTTPSGWTAEGSITGAGGYGTTLGADTGNTNLFVFSKDANGTESGTLSVTVANNNVCWGKIARVPVGSKPGFSIAMTTGSDTTAGNVSITGAANPGVTAGDRVVCAMCIPTDVTTPAQFSAHAITQTGITFGTVSEIEEQDSATGNDIGGFITETPVNSGTASAAPTFTATAGGTTTNVRGPGVFIRIRDVALVRQGTGSAGGSATVEGQRGDDANAQYLYPDSDITDGSWLRQDGSNVDIFASIDEVPPVNYTDYARSFNVAVFGAGDSFESGLSNPTDGDPTVDTGHVLEAEGFLFSSDDIAQLAPVLRQGTTTIWTGAAIETSASSTFFQIASTIPSANIANITDYSALRLQWLLSDSSGVNNEVDAYVYWARLRIPKGSQGAGAGSAAGAATVTGVGRAIHRGAGSAAGTTSVTGDGEALAKAAGSAAGAATVTAVGRAKFRGVGNAAGAATVSGTIRNANGNAGTSVGTSTATAVGRATAKAAGSSAGTSTAAAVGRTRIDGAGTATGAATVTAVGRARARGVGSATGSTTVTGAGRATGRVPGAGLAAGTSTATGVIRNANEILQPTTGGTKWPQKLWMPPKKKPKVVRGTGFARGTSTAVGVGRVIWTQRGAGSARARAKTAGTGRASYDAYNARRIAEFLDMLRMVDF